MGDHDPTKPATIGGDVLHVVGSVFDPAALGGALTELNIDAGTIEEILETLGTGQDDMPQQLLDAGATSFGSLPRGLELGQHTTLARNYLRSAVLEMLQTLGLYFDGVRAFRDGTTSTDTYSAAELKKISSVVEQATAVNDRHYRHDHPNGAHGRGHR